MESLSQEMTQIIETGFQMLKHYRGAIEKEWQAILTHLQRLNDHNAKELETIILFFFSYIFDRKHEHADDLLRDLHAAKTVMQQTPSPYHIIFGTMLLENAVHKAINEENHPLFQDHQAVQYLFTHINEELFGYSNEDNLSIDLVLKQLAESHQLPIHWIARIQQEHNGLVIKKFFDGKSNQLAVRPSHPFNTIFEVSEWLLDHCSIGVHTKPHTFPLLWKNETLLFCMDKVEAYDLTAFIAFTLHLIEKKDRTFEWVNQKQKWKDAVILFNEWLLRSKNLDEAIENITTGFVKYLPFERCALFSYSSTDHSILGLHGYQFDCEAVKRIRDKSDNFPFIDKKLKRLKPLEKNFIHLQPIYTTKARDGFPPQYVKQFELDTVVISPIYVLSEGKLIGAALLDCGPGVPFTLNRDTFTALIKFGQIAGELLYKINKDRFIVPKRNPPSFHLSPREIDVLKLMADGESTSEMARILDLSEYTVRDYVSAIMQKMNARNRTEAATKAIRYGII